MTIIFSGISSVQNAILVRNLQFKKSFKYRLLAIFLQGVTGISLALLGYGVWALVVANIVNSIIMTLSLWIVVDWKPKLFFSFSKLGNLFSFSSRILVLNLINTIYNSITSLIIGKSFSAMTYGANEKYIYRYPFTSLLEQDLLEEPITLDRKREVRKELEMKEEKIVLSVGRFDYGKGFDLLIDACKNLPRDLGVYIVGGEAPEEYIHQRDSLGLSNIHFISFKPKEELKKYYEASDLFVLPTRGDVWGLVINEAMAFGLAVITTDKCVAGLELLKDGVNGYIVPVDESDELREKMKEVLYTDNLAEEMGISNLSKIEDYTVENMARIHLEIFKEIV